MLRLCAGFVEWEKEVVDELLPVRGVVWSPDYNCTEAEANLEVLGGGGGIWVRVERWRG